MASEARHHTSTSSARLPIPPSTSLRMPNPNVFSDEYALDPLDNSASSSPTSSIHHSDHYPPVDIFSTPRPSTENDRSLPAANSISNRPISTQKRPLDVQDDDPRRSMSVASHAESGTHRASSTSSRFSIPRPQSPYGGASGPSHPYAMYPQVTRASSIASASTVRPAERAFIPPARPEHPYAMYSQNIVPEEDDGRLPQMSIPLGFPGLGQMYQQGSRSAGNDIADIVGADGHVEELPPYTRYPDNGIPKDSMPQLDIPTNGQTQDWPDVSMSPQSTGSPFPDNGIAVNVAAARTISSDSDGSFKERWKEKSKRRVLCGLPLWCLLILIAIMILVGAAGGVIGGVVANRQQGDAVTDAQPDRSTPSAATVTVTSWIDASPLPTATNIPNIPTGIYNLPTDQINLNSSSCIVDAALSAAWGCMPPGGLWVNVEPLGSFYQATFEPFPVNPNFQYGPQPPNLDGVSQPLFPFMDKDASSLGPAMFFYDLYDKLVILPAEALNTYTPSKRSLSVSDIAARDFPPGHTGQPGDRPWFCWFNQTILEFFIYLDHNTTSSSASTAISPFSTSMVNNGMATPPSLTTLYLPSDTSAYPTSRPSWPATKEKRDYTYKRDESNWRDPQSSGYPLWIKLEEKRKPENNVQPYCQQMRLLNNGDIVVQEDVQIINVTETEPSTSSSRKRDDMDGSVAALGSNCVCEWLAKT